MAAIALSSGSDSFIISSTGSICVGSGSSSTATTLPASPNPTANKSFAASCCSSSRACWEDVLPVMRLALKRATTRALNTRFLSPDSPLPL
jgi:hypothetical protein